MEVLSLCPFRAGALVWQSAPNAWSLTVVVKATFTIVPGAEATVAPVQAPVAAFAADMEGAVEDLSPLKPKVDVLVVRGRNEDSATIEVSSSVLSARGPVPPFAPARRLLLQEQGLEWAAAVLRGEAAAAGPVPEGFDFSFFHIASREQRIDLLRSGVPLVLKDVLPNQARVETILPQRKPQAFRIHPQTGKASEIILRCDTLCIDAARRLLVLTFRGIADIDAASLSNMGTIVVAAHSSGKKIRGDRIERFLRNGEPIEGEANDGRHPLEKRYDTVLAAPKGDTMALPEMDGASAAVWPAAPLTSSDSGLFKTGGGLPFQPGASDAPPPLVAPEAFNAPARGRRHATLSTPTDAKRSLDLPFPGALPPPVPDAYLPPPPPEGVFPPPPALMQIAQPEPPPLIKPPAMLGSSFAQDEKTADLPPGHTQMAESEHTDDATVDLPPKAATVLRAGALPPPVPGLAGKPTTTAPKPSVLAPGAPKPALSAPKAPTAPKPAMGASSAPKPLAPAAVAPKPAAPKGPIKVPAPLGPKLKTENPAKPGLAPPVAEKSAPVGPAKPSVAAASKPVVPAKPGPMRPAAATVLFPSIIKPGTVPAGSAPQAPAAEPTEEVQESFHAAEALTLEQCAALEAELRHRSSARKEIFEKNHLSDEKWKAVHKHWADAIAKETEVGERKLLIAYDSAYVAVQEKLGVKVGIDTHAKLQVAAERGTTPAVLKELGLEPADQMRLGRVWTQRLADDPARMRELGAAIEKARAG